MSFGLYGDDSCQQLALEGRPTQAHIEDPQLTQGSKLPVVLPTHCLLWELQSMWEKQELHGD